MQDPPKNVTPPGQPAATETGNRGGEASTSASGPSLAEPDGNDHTAKWKIYTGLAKKLVAQVFSHLSFVLPVEPALSLCNCTDSSNSGVGQAQEPLHMHMQSQHADGPPHSRPLKSVHLRLVRLTLPES